MMIELHQVRDTLLSVDWALLSFFLVKLTPFELVSGNILKNFGGVALFATFIILFELFGKELIWRLVGKHHRLWEQTVFLIAMLAGLAVLFTLFG